MLTTCADIPPPRLRAANKRRNLTDSKPLSGKTGTLLHNLAAEAKWTPGLREIFEYRDLGIKDGTRATTSLTSFGTTAKTG